MIAAVLHPPLSMPRRTSNGTSLAVCSDTRHLAVVVLGRTIQSRALWRAQDRGGFPFSQAPCAFVALVVGAGAFGQVRLALQRRDGSHILALCSLRKFGQPVPASQHIPSSFSPLHETCAVIVRVAKGIDGRSDRVVAAVAESTRLMLHTAEIVEDRSNACLQRDGSIAIIYWSHKVDRQRADDTKVEIVRHARAVHASTTNTIVERTITSTVGALHA
mmetsp:Transcript_20206/g.47834  ORF Transcript_20206/g.47834 Transcript_20206/m.47834 type:complete len:218 (-) Transcript_20206:273-926(-)